MTYTPPTPAQIRAMLAHYQLTGASAAKLAGLSGSNKIRAYTGGDRPTVMSYSVAFTLAAKCLLDPATIARIEAAMPDKLPPPDAQ